MKKIYSYRLFAKVPPDDVGDPKGEFRKRFRERNGNEFGEYGDIEWTDYLPDGGAELGTSIKKKDIPVAIEFLKKFKAYDFRVLKTVTEEVILACQKSASPWQPTGARST